MFTVLCLLNSLRSLVCSVLLVMMMIFNFTQGSLSTLYSAVFTHFGSCSFYTFLGSAVNQLNNWGSDFKDDRFLGTEKCGPACKVQPIDELFLVLYQLCCDALKKDIRDRFDLHPSSVSCIVIF